MNENVKIDYNIERLWDITELLMFCDMLIIMVAYFAASTLLVLGMSTSMLPHLCRVKQHNSTGIVYCRS